MSGLTNQQSGKLGGLRAAANMTEAERQRRSAKGGRKTAERGREYYVRLAHRRWGRKVELSGGPTTDGKSAGGPGAGQGDKAGAVARVRKGEAGHED